MGCGDVLREQRAYDGRPGGEGEGGMKRGREGGSKGWSERETQARVVQKKIKRNDLMDHDVRHHDDHYCSLYDH